MSVSNTIQEVPYVPVSATETMSNAPRFGHSSDFSELFSKEPGAPEDYVAGLVFATGFILAVFILWSILLLIFKCLGPSQVGFLSGAPFKKPNHVEEENFMRPFRVRMTVLGCGITFILFTILLVVNGITNLQDTVSTVSNSNQDIVSLINDADAIAVSLQSVGTSTMTVRDELVADLGDFCPADANIVQDTGYDFDALAQEAIDLMSQLGDFVSANINEFRQALSTARQTTDEVDNIAHKFDIHDWQSLIILVPFIIVPSFLLVALLLSTYDISFSGFTCFISWFIVPLFAIIVTFSYVASSIVSAMTVANADFCSGGVEQTPDETVKAILKIQGFDDSELVSETILFYISQCQTADPWAFITDYYSQIDSAVANVAELGTAINAVSVDRLNLICGKDFSTYQSLLSTMQANLGILSADAAAALDILSCERIVPIYTNAVYGGTCTYSVTGVAWMFSSFLVIAFVGMLMLTFRAAFYETEVDSDDQRSPEEDSDDGHNPSGVSEPHDDDDMDGYADIKKRPSSHEEQSVQESKGIPSVLW